MPDDTADADWRFAQWFVEDASEEPCAALPAEVQLHFSQRSPPGGAGRAPPLGQWTPPAGAGRPVQPQFRASACAARTLTAKEYSRVKLSL